MTKSGIIAYMNKMMLLQALIRQVVDGIAYVLIIIVPFQILFCHCLVPFIYHRE